jgi:hypothetical protein
MGVFVASRALTKALGHKVSPVAYLDVRADTLPVDSPRQEHPFWNVNFHFLPADYSFRESDTSSAITIL